METPKIVWVVLGGLIAAITIILIACLVINPQTAYQATVIQGTFPVTLDLFKIIVGAVVGALGTTVGMTRK